VRHDEADALKERDGAITTGRRPAYGVFAADFAADFAAIFAAVFAARVGGTYAAA
jgi:hypothetical protein